MSASTETLTPSSTEPVGAAPPLEEVASYRSLSSAAVVCLVLGLLSPLTAVAWVMAAIPALALVVGAWALWRIRRFPDDYTGVGLAKTGMALAAVSWPLGWGRLAYEYATEVPPGYQRISYAELQTDPARPNEIVPASAAALDGKRVFIKGYVYPGATDHGIRRFLLVRDNGTCCFGGEKPKLNDMIDVTLTGDLAINYSTGVRKVAGTFKVAPQQGIDPSVGIVLYQLEADYVK